MEQLNSAFEILGRGLEYAGVLIVAGAAIVAVFQLLNLQTPALVRRQFAEWILTGLEFIIAA